MAGIPKKVADRIADGLKRFQPIVSAARDRDINESNTVVIITDMLSDIFGYDKYSEITTEHGIRGTFCDLAIVINNDLRFIIEVKAMGIGLRDLHVKQAIDYAANKGVDWAILTNGVEWRVYKVIFEKPINQDLLVEFDILKLNHKNPADLDRLFLLAKEGLDKSALADYQTQLQATNRYMLAALLLSEPILYNLRRELKRQCPDVKIELEELRENLVREVLKREVIEGEKAEEASKKIQRLYKKRQKEKASQETDKPNDDGGKQNTDECSPTDDTSPEQS